MIELFKTGHQTKENVKQVGVREHSMRKWVKCMKDGGGVNIFTHKPRLSLPKKTPSRTDSSQERTKSSSLSKEQSSPR